jgi:hypothetical protein
LSWYLTAQQRWGHSPVFPPQRNDPDTIEADFQAENGLIRDTLRQQRADT